MTNIQPPVKERAAGAKMVDAMTAAGVHPGRGSMANSAT